MTRIVIADDHPLVLIGLHKALDGVLGMQLCAEAQDSTGLVAALESGGADVVITDFHMPGGRYGDGGSLVGLLQRRYPALRIIVITMLSNPLLLEQIIVSGVQGLLLKSAPAEEIRRAVQAVADGGQYVGEAVRTILAQLRSERPRAGDAPASLQSLSPREMEVLRLFVGGLSVSEIAATLHRSIKTVSHQKVAALHKLGISNDRELYEYALREGLL